MLSKTQNQTTPHQHVARTIALGALVLSLFVAACSTTPKPQVLVDVDTDLAEPSLRARATKVTPQNLEAALRYQGLANTAYEDGEEPLTLHLAEVARIYTDAVMEDVKAADAKDAHQRWSLRLVKARNETRKAEVAQEHFDKRIARMEKIVELQKQVEGAAADKAAVTDQLKAELEQAKVESERTAEAQAAQLELERRTAEVRAMITAAVGKVETAAAMDARTADPANYETASKNLAEANMALEKGAFDDAVRAVEVVNKAIDAAIDTAHVQFAAKNQELDLLAERKQLFDEVSAVGSPTKQDKRGIVITLYDMFEPGKAQVLGGRLDELAKISEIANAHPNFPVIVEGYTDSYGAASANLALSTSRAQSVADVLVQSGKVDMARVRSAGYGEERAVADNSKKEGRAKNRRTEVVFLFR